MKAFPAAFAILAIFLAGCAAEHAANASPSEVSEAFAAAYNARDAAGIAALFTDDAELLIPDAPPVRGREAIAALFRTKFEQNCTMEIRSIASRAAGDQGFDTGAIAISMPDENGASHRVSGRYLSVMTRVGQDLKIAYQMHTVEPE